MPGILKELYTEASSRASYGDLNFTWRHLANHSHRDSINYAKTSNPCYQLEFGYEGIDNLYRRWVG